MEATSVAAIPHTARTQLPSEQPHQLPETSIAVIVPTLRLQDHSRAVRYLRNRKAAPALAEVVVAAGRCPSQQRNLAAAESDADVLAFIDDDVTPSADWAKRLAQWYANPRVVGVCGPNVAPPDERSLVARAVDVVLTSTFGVFGKKSKYTASHLAEAGDNGLILCNASFRREFFFEVGRFRPELYPNEENEFLERARARLGDRWIIYDPRAVVYRPRPRTIREHLRSIFGYGVGRVNQLLTRPSLCSLANLLPALALVVGGLSIVLALWSWLFLVPHAVYAAALLCTSLYHCRQRRCGKLLPLLWLLYPGTHAAYALGQLCALLRWQRHSQRVDLDESHIEIRRYRLKRDQAKEARRTAKRNGHSNGEPLIVSLT